VGQRAVDNWGSNKEQTLVSDTQVRVLWLFLTRCSVATSRTAGCLSH
jgi:hypothetical protein